MRRVRRKNEPALRLVPSHCWLFAVTAIGGVDADRLPHSSSRHFLTVTAQRRRLVRQHCWVCGSSRLPIHGAAASCEENREVPLWHAHSLQRLRVSNLKPCNVARCAAERPRAGPAGEAQTRHWSADSRSPSFVSERREWERVDVPS